MESEGLNKGTVLGDLNRFERDIMGVGHDGDRLAQEYAEASGTDVETVRRVLAAVFDGADYGLSPVVPLPDWQPASDRSPL